MTNIPSVNAQTQLVDTIRDDTTFPIASQTFTSDGATTSWPLAHKPLASALDLITTTPFSLQHNVGSMNTDARLAVLNAPLAAGTAFVVYYHYDPSAEQDGLI